jgi:predicted CoA-binding protein
VAAAVSDFPGGSGVADPALNPDVQLLRRIYKENHVIAVVGLSANWYRPSYFAAKYMLDHGYRVIPVNPQYREVLGQKCYPSLMDIPEKVDIVDCFRKSEEIPALCEQAVAIGAKVLWMQIGVINEAAARRAREAGLEVVMDRCVKIEYARLFGGLNWMGVNTGIISSKRPLWLTY